MTSPFVKILPSKYYGVNTKIPPASWDSHSMWRCTKHIPSSKVYPAFVEKCPTCNQPRPPEDRRPADPYAPPVRLVPSLPAADTDPNATIEAPPAVVTEESLENMRTLRDVTAELNFDKDMSLGQAQRDFDALVMGDLLSTTTSVVRAIQDDGVAKIQDEVGRELAAELRSSAASLKSRKAKCPGPGCRKSARESSPYCSKICSDRCLRLRKKTTPLTKVEAGHLNRIETALANWRK